MTTICKHWYDTCSKPSFFYCSLLALLLCKFTDAIQDILIPFSDGLYGINLRRFLQSWMNAYMHANLICVPVAQYAHTEYISKVLTLFFFFSCVNICCLYSAEITTLSSPLWQPRLHFRVHYDKVRWGVFDRLNAQPLWRVIAPVQQRPVRRNLCSSISSLKCLLLINTAGAKLRSWNRSLTSAGLGRFGHVRSFFIVQKICWLQEATITELQLCCCLCWITSICPHLKPCWVILTPLVLRRH